MHALLITNGLVIDGSKGIGESNNIHVAGGVRIMGLPVTAEKVLAGLRANGRCASRVWV